MNTNIDVDDEALATWFEASSPEDYVKVIEGSAKILLYRAARLRRQAEDDAVAAVRAARREGLAWQQIGEALGISRQWAFQHYKPLIEA